MGLRHLAGAGSSCAAIALAAAWAVGVGPAVAAGGCAPAGATVVARSGATALYSSGESLYGCLGNRATRLGALDEARHFVQARVAHWALAGRYVGIDVATMGIDTFASMLSVIDLATGRRTASAPATAPENRAESFISATSLSIDPAGTLVWVGSRSAVGAFTPIYEVRALGEHGDQLLDSGAHIKPSSLTLSGHELSWIDGAHQRHAQLAP